MMCAVKYERSQSLKNGASALTCTLLAIICHIAIHLELQYEECEYVMHLAGRD